MIVRLFLIAIFLGPSMAQSKVDSIYYDGERASLRLLGEFAAPIDSVTIDDESLQLTLWTPKQLQFRLGVYDKHCSGILKLYSHTEVEQYRLSELKIDITSHHVRLNEYWQAAPPYWDVTYLLRTIIIAGENGLANYWYPESHIEWECLTKTADVFGIPNQNVYHRGNGSINLQDAGVTFNSSIRDNQIEFDIAAPAQEVKWEMWLETHQPFTKGAEGKATAQILPISLRMRLRDDGSIVAGQDSVSSKFTISQVSWDSVAPLKPPSEVLSVAVGAALSATVLVSKDNIRLPEDIHGWKLYTSLGQLLSESPNTISILDVTSLAAGMYVLKSDHLRSPLKILRLP